MVLEEQLDIRMVVQEIAWIYELILLRHFVIL